MNPEKEKVGLEVHKTKKITEKVTVDMVSAERTIREMLANKIAGTFCGLWFLVAEQLRIGTWDLLKGWTGNNQLDMRGLVCRLLMKPPSALMVACGHGKRYVGRDLKSLVGYLIFPRTSKYTCFWINTLL
ncbi:MAG: hypothetical protein HY965_08930, partial [Ignavibacteriales bacterium]|nr:hypothetical protein [Ignavibacteriales bacterium]